MDIAQFRLDFPEFTDVVRYPDSQISFWSTVAEAQVRSEVWDTQTDFAVKLYVAHEITIAAQNVNTAQFGGAPGGVFGPVNSKGVGNVNVGYDTQSITEKDAGYWNLTNYGRQLIRLARLYGAGAIQVC